MSVFSEYLQTLFQQTGLTVYALSKAAGVERTFLHKILNGTRMPSSESVVERIGEAMRLTGEQVRLLYEQYQIGRDGREVYERRREVSRLLTGMYLPARQNNFEVQRRVDVHALPHVATDRVTVLRLLKLLLDVEVAGPNGSVQLLCGTEDDFLWHLLNMYIDVKPDLPIRQILHLQSGGTHQALLYNLGLLQHTLPLVLSGTDYEALVCYGEPAPQLLLPNLLLTSRYALQFSDDFSAAMLSDDPEHVALFSTLLTRQTRGCHPLIRRLHHPMELLNHYAGVTDHLEGAAGQNKLYSLGPEPCMSPFYTPALLEEFLCPALRTPEHMRPILDYFSRTRRLLDRCQVTHYFTAAGTRNFMHTGRLTELPSSFYTPLSPAVRQHLLMQQIARAEALPSFLPLALDTEKLHLPENLILETTITGAFSLIYAHPDSGFLSFLLEEPLLCNALFDYLESLHQSRCVFSKEDSLTLLRSILAEEMPSM